LGISEKAAGYLGGVVNRTGQIDTALFLPSRRPQTGAGCSSVVEHSPSMYKALGLIPAPKKKKKKLKK
jgi:hypothetical protein